MIGKGRFFDLITKTAEDINNPDNDIDIIIEKYKKREEELKSKLRGNE